MTGGRGNGVYHIISAHNFCESYIQVVTVVGQLQVSMFLKQWGRRRGGGGGKFVCT